MLRESTKLPDKTTADDRDRLTLVSNYQPAGDQGTAIAGLVEGLNDGLARQILLGVTGSGKTFTVASVIERVQRPAIILAPNKTLAAQLYGEMREFFPRNAVEYFVSYYDYYQPEAYVPSSDTYIEKDASINQHIEQMRLSATKALIERPDAIIVATVSAIYGLGDPEAYFSMVLHLSRGDRVDQRSLLRRLAELQYQRNELDFSQGTYRVRGDVIDIFPAESDRDAVRVELFDDEIESLSYFDPLTGEVTRRVPRLTVFPKTHYVSPRERLLEACEHVKVELKERLEYLRKKEKLLEAQRNLGLVAMLKEFRELAQLDLVITFVRSRSKLDFLYVHSRLLAPRCLSLFILLKQVLAEIHNPANRRFCCRRHLDEIEPNILREVYGICQRHYPGLLALRVYDTNFSGLYFLVTPYALCNCDPVILQPKTCSRSLPDAMTRRSRCGNAILYSPMPRNNHGNPCFPKTIRRFVGF